MSIAIEVQNIGDVDFLVRDDPNAPPHLFIDNDDSVCSSITGFSCFLDSPSHITHHTTARSSSHYEQTSSVRSPHVFLPYAAPQNSSTLLQPVHQELPRHNVNPAEDFNASTPHMFLPYATRGYQQLLSRIENSEKAKLPRYDSLQFEAQCLDFFRSDHELSLSQSSLAAKAIGKASEQTTFAMDGTSTTTKRKDHQTTASFFDAALRRAMGSSESDPAQADETSSGNSEEVNEELNFLRNCVRELVLRISDNDNKHNSDDNGDPLFPEDVFDLLPNDLEGFRKVGKVGQDQGFDHTNALHEVMQPSAIPERIEIPFRTSHFNGSDGSDVVSLLTPFDGESLFKYSRPVLEDNDDPVVDESLDIQPFVPVSSFTLSSDADTLKDLDLKGAARYIETVQLLLKCRPGRPSRKLLMNDSEPLPVTAHKLRLQMNIMGVSFTGSYNGSLQRGVPHGPGVFRFDNRDLYVGNFAHGMMNGDGTLFCKKKICHQGSKLAVLRGRFEKNEFKGGRPTRDDTTSAGAA